MLVDLTIFLLAAAFGIDMAIMQPFIFDKTCRSMLRPDDSLSKCENTSVDHQFEIKVDKSTSNFMQILSVAQHLPTLLVIPFIGTYSDLYGRRFPIFLSIIGMCIKYFMTIYAATFADSSIYILVAGSVVCGFTGYIAIGSCFALYVDLIADPALRTIRLGFASSVLALGILVTSLISGVIVDRFSYAYAFMLAEVFICLATFSTVFLPEAPRAAATLKTRIITSCNYQRYLDMIRLITMPRLGKCRMFLLSAVSLMIALSLLQAGESGVLVLYLKVSPFNWSTKRLAIFRAIEAAAAAISMGLVVYVFKRILKVEDTIMILFGLTVMGLRSALLAVSKQSIEIYIAAIITIFAHIHWPACRSFISQQVSTHEVGRHLYYSFAKFA